MNTAGLCSMVAGGAPLCSLYSCLLHYQPAASQPGLQAHPVQGGVVVGAGRGLQEELHSVGSGRWQQLSILDSHSASKAQGVSEQQRAAGRHVAGCQLPRMQRPW